MCIQNRQKKLFLKTGIFDQLNWNNFLIVWFMKGFMAPSQELIILGLNYKIFQFSWLIFFSILSIYNNIGSILNTVIPDFSKILKEFVSKSNIFRKQNRFCYKTPKYFFFKYHRDNMENEPEEFGSRMHISRNQIRNCYKNEPLYIRHLTTTRKQRLIVTFKCKGQFI